MVSSIYIHIYNTCVKIQAKANNKRLTIFLKFNLKILDIYKNIKNIHIQNVYIRSLLYSSYFSYI